MHIRDIGVSTLKGCRHQPRDGIRLDADGPVGDRDFAVVDLNIGQILRTVENPALVACGANWVDGVLSATIDGHRIAAVPVPSGATVDLDYWGRLTPMQVLDGPWASEFSRLLGRDVVLARSLVAGGAVYADSVTIATTSSLDRLASQCGIKVDTRRFRSTFTIDTGDAPAHLEDEWAGRELQLGGARLLLKGGIPRCAVIDIDPDLGVRGTNLLKTLGGYRLQGSDIMFGIYAEVISPGFVSAGDDVVLV